MIQITLCIRSGIIIHEYSHGISTRLTGNCYYLYLIGGPANVGCLGWGESGGIFSSFIIRNG